MLLDFLYLLSSDESYLLDDESEYDGYDSRSSGTYSFTNFLCIFTNSVGRVSVLGSGVFVPTEVKSKCDIFSFVVCCINRSQI